MMAGLLDIFGSSGSQTLGLLGMSPEDVQRARDDAQAQAMYTLAGRLFQGGNTGRSIAEGLQLGQQAYKQAMQGQLAETLQGAQIQELLRQRQEAQAIKQRQESVNRIIGQAYQPAVAAQPAQEIYGEDIMGQRVGEGMTPAIQARPAQFDLTGATPLLMALPEGRKALTEIVAAQKAMRPEGYILGEGQVRYEMGPDGKPVAVASGAPKREPIPSAIAEYNFAKDQGYKGTFQEFELSKRAAGAPKVAVDLKDPTAVANAQKGVISDWRAVVKDTGATEVADRYKAAIEAVTQGNAGNKSADGALIYAIGKIYDPSGAVQEGDKGTILGNRSIPDSIKAYANRVFTGQSLLPEERQGLLSIATKIVEAKAKNLESQKAPYTSISRQLGGTGELLINPLADVLKQPAPNDLAAAALAELARRKKGQ
jgi:hypothetical protein